MARTLAAVAREVQGRLVGVDQSFGAVTTDTRALGPGSLFVAIPGDRFDGNDFVDEALTKGAAGALVSRVAASALPQIEVRDSRRALGAMARAWRASFSIPAVAVTGSSGKTTVKELIAAILGVSRSICVTQGNLNNDIGVPLTLMRLTVEHDAARRRARREPRRRDRLPRAARAADGRRHHERGRGASRGLRLAARRLCRQRRAARSLAARRHGGHQRRRSVPQRLGRALALRIHRHVRFCAERRLPRARRAAASWRRARSSACACPTARRPTSGCRLLGRQNVANALAAAAAAQAVGASTDDIVAGLARAMPVRGRLRAVPGRNGATIIDDSYNANPGSVHAALDHLAGSAAGGSSCSATWPSSGRRRRRCTRRSASTRAAAAICCSRSASSRAKRRRRSARRAAASPTSRRRELRSIRLLASDTTVLVKGSRVMGLDRLVQGARSRRHEGALMLSTSPTI